MLTDGVRDIKMKEELATRDDLCSVLEMFNLVNKCARAKEGRLSLPELPGANLEDKKAKAKEAKPKGPAVLAVEPKMKHSHDHDEPPRGNRPFCICRNTHTHNTTTARSSVCSANGCIDRRPECNDHGYDRGGGHSGGRWDDRDSRQG